MLYRAYQAYSEASEPIRMMARAGLSLGPLFTGISEVGFGKHYVAALELISRTRLSHARPDYRIESTLVDGEPVPVHEKVVASLPFCNLVRFSKESAAPQPKMLVVAPLSGHFATLLRETVRTLVRDHEVYITDWKNARDVPLEEGPFGFDDYVDYIIRCLELIGPGAHVLAVCQPCVQTLAAVAVMAEQRNPAEPRSMTLMAGPVDVRVNPSKVNELATSKPIEWFEDNLIAHVPDHLPGGGRRVYPGFVQLTAFVSMNMDRHVKAHRDLYEHLSAGREAEAKAIKSFYDEYFAVLDLPAEFYLETVKTVFQDASLAKGELTYRGKKVDPRAIRRTALLTVEGERDDICSVGQTAAAHLLCNGLRPHLKRHHYQVGVGHYGTFSGRRWNGQIYPVIRNLVLAMN
ncbi:polyhydroxyalkanoate depolymerase [Methylovirgula ligni]|uniref:Polyhydroxyalkanoate depolymerase n=1 Tax=Methylovirgula ligni TaxID=569860 RepID=A0A3D9YX82_9HYPH|nr:polyhydroxyalkanoate depolymerase [Methylovirgula ligni]QAY94745.1 polyhydroxyalkanoate depolymerase [Methylovirgula ligni]REF87363.1 polyhydroxyalkanoate depolymerase [Methylovirgula ligni]